MKEARFCARLTEIIDKKKSVLDCSGRFFILHFGDDEFASAIDLMLGFCAGNSVGAIVY